MASIRKGLAALLMVAALVAPTSAFAATSSSSTAESLSVASTVSMTAPANATFSLVADQGIGTAAQDFITEVTITVIGSNNPTGVTVSATVDPWTQDGIVIPTTKRYTYKSQATVPGATVDGLVGTLDSVSNLPLGTFADSSTVVVLGTSAGPLANASLGMGYGVDSPEFAVGGTYTSGVHYTTSTNP